VQAALYTHEDSWYSFLFEVESTYPRKLLPPYSGPKNKPISKSVGKFYQTTRCNIPEDRKLQAQGHFNFVVMQCDMFIVAISATAGASETPSIGT
jgi:hypothetical protein